MMVHRTQYRIVLLARTNTRKVKLVRLSF